MNREGGQVSNCRSIPGHEPVQAAEPLTEFWAKGTGASVIGNRSLTRFLTPSPDFFHAEPRRVRRSEDWILSANSASPRETLSSPYSWQRLDVAHHTSRRGFPWLSFPLFPFRQPGRAFIGGVRFHLLDGSRIEAGAVNGLCSTPELIKIE